MNMNILIIRVRVKLKTHKVNKSKFQGFLPPPIASNSKTIKSAVLPDLFAVPSDLSQQLNAQSLREKVEAEYNLFVLEPLTHPAPGREFHVIVGSDKGVSSVPGREIHVYPGGSESDHFSLTKYALIDMSVGKSRL